MASSSLTVRQIEAFRALMLRHTVTRAAEMMHVSQPAMSRLIADLEASAGIMLFERNLGRLLPTAEAHMLFLEVERAFVGLGRIAQVTDQIRSMRRGSLRIAGEPVVGLDLLPETLSAFTRTHDGVDVTLFTDTLRIVTDLVAGQRCDVGFIAEDVPFPGVQLEAIYEAPLKCIMSRGHRLAQKQVIHPEDLADEVFVSFPRSSDVCIAIDRVFSSHGVSRKTSIEAQLSGSIAALVEYGAGVSLINPIGAHYARGRIVARDFEPSIPTFIYSVTLKGFQLSKLGAEFVTYVKRKLAEVT